MKHIDYRIERLLHEGLSISTLERFSSKQIQVLYEKVKKSNKETKEAVTKTTTSTTYTKDEAKGKTFSKADDVNVTINQDDSVTVTKEGEEEDVSNVNKGEDDQDPIQKQGPDGMPTESEIREKSVSKKQRGLMGAAYSVEKGYKKISDIPKSYRSKVKDVVKSMTKKQIKDFAGTSDDELKEGFKDYFFKKDDSELDGLIADADNMYGETGNCYYVIDGNYGMYVTDDMTENEDKILYDTCEDEVGNIEESILRLVQNHLPPHTTKKQLINYISKKR